MAVFAVQPNLGVDVSKALASTDTPAFAVGTIIRCSDGEYVYVSASAAITQYDVVAITSAYAAAPATSVLVKSGFIAVADATAIASGGYGFVKLRGATTIRCLASCAPGKPLFVYATTTQVGRVDDATSGGVRINGLVTTASATSAAASLAGIASYPHAIL